MRPLQEGSQQCQRKLDREARKIACISRQKTLRLLQAASQPLQPTALHPARSALHIANQHIETAADPNRNRYT